MFLNRILNKRGDYLENMALEKTIKKAKKGHKRAFEMLIKSYDKKVFGYIYSLTKDRYFSDDIYQEVWIKVIKNIDKYDEQQPFSAWLITISRNTTYDAIKRRKVFHLPLHTCDRQSSSLATPEEMLLKRERLEKLDKQLNDLSDRDRNLIILRYFEGLSYEEIAHHFSVDKATIKWQLQDAKKRLKKVAGEEVWYEV